VKPPPDCQRLLESLRLRGINRRRRGGSGRHLMRQRGQSLDFREHLPYQPGMDVRHVDWRASFRYGKPDDLLVKTFVAEEDLTLLISVDTRPSMWLPGSVSKVQIAAWLAWAIGHIGLRSGDRVVLHRLYGSASGSVREYRGSTALDGLWSGIESLIGSEPADASTMNLRGLNRLLPPSSAWLVLSDFYFELDPAARRLAAAMLKAREGNRWVIHGDLDTWPAERAIMGNGARRIEGPGAPEDIECDVQDRTIAAVEKNIEAHKERFRELSRCNERFHWEWSEEWTGSNVDAGLWFKENLARDPVVQQLFLRRGSAG